MQTPFCSTPDGIHSIQSNYFNSHYSFVLNKLKRPHTCSATKRKPKATEVSIHPILWFACENYTSISPAEVPGRDTGKFILASSTNLSHHRNPVESCKVTSSSISSDIPLRKRMIAEIFNQTIECCNRRSLIIPSRNKLSLSLHITELKYEAQRNYGVGRTNILLKRILRKQRG